MEQEVFDRYVEALVFCSPKPIGVGELQQCLSEAFEQEMEEATIAASLVRIGQRYQAEESVMELVHAAGGYQLMTKPAYQHVVATLLKQQSKKRISRSALETLSIIAYRQPVSKTEIEQIRGVSADYALKKLLERQLIELRGKSSAPGRPMLYGTSPLFLEHFGINSLKELPTLKDFAEEEAEESPGGLPASPGTEAN